MHANLVLFGIWLGMVHAFVQLAVPQGKVRLIDEGVPFLNRFDPIGIGMGTVALELFVAFTLSVLVQRKLGYHRWRMLHSLAYFAFTIVVAHILVAGSDIAGTTVRVVIVAAWSIAIAAGIVTFPSISRIPRRMVDRTFGQVRAADVTVNVDPSRCARFGFCEHEAPAIFSLRSDGRLAYRSSVSADQADAAMQAAMVCPARAITLGKLPTAVVVPKGDPAAAVNGSGAAPAPGTRLNGGHTGPQPQYPTGPQQVGAPGLAAVPPGPPMGGPHTGPQGPYPVPDGPPPGEGRWGSPLDDTGRHHVRPLRPPVGRPGGRR